MSNIDYIETWKEVIESPSAFYREMPTNGGYFHPIVFATVSVAIALLFGLLLNPLVFPETGNTGELDTGELTYTTIPLVVIAVIVIFNIGLFINATLLYITCKALGGKGSYEGTLGLVCYATAALVLAWMPFIGWFFGIYQTYLYIVGGKFVHDISMGRSVLAFIMSTLLVLVFALLVPLNGQV